MQRRSFIQSLSSILALITSPILHSSNNSNATNSESSPKPQPELVNAHDKLLAKPLLILGIGQSAGKFLQDLKKTKLDQYKNSMTGQKSPEINYSFVDACFPVDTANFYWHHDFPQDLNWNTHDYVNEIEEMSWKKYKSRHEWDVPDFLNQLDHETTSRLHNSNAIMHSEIQFDHDVEDFIAENHRFNNGQIVIIIYDVSDQAARRLIKPLLLSAKRNRVDLTFSICLRSFIPNLSSSNNVLFREMYYSSRQGEKYADFDMQFFARALTINKNRHSINDWHTGYEPFQSPIDKTKGFIDAISSLHGGTSLISADIADLWTCFHGYKSTGFTVSTYEGKTTESGSLIAERACQQHSIQPHKPVLRMLVNIVVNQTQPLAFYEDILSSISNRLGDTSVALINSSENLSEDTVQLTLISV